MNKLKKHFCKTMAIVLTVLASCNVWGVEAVFAEPTVVDSGNCGSEGHEGDVTWELTSEDGGQTCHLEIKGIGEMKHYNNVNFPWYSYKTKITSLSINAGVTSIGDDSFCGCSNLAQASLPVGITNIGYASFERCTSLALTSLPDEIEGIGQYAFDGCSSLALTSLPDSIDEIGHTAFRDCSNLALTYIPEGIEYIGDDVFNGCTGLTEVYYGGTKEEWEARVTVGTGNDCLTNALRFASKNINMSVSGFTGTYDGKAHGITVSVTDPASGTTVKYGTTEGTYNLDKSPAYTDIGTHTVYYRVRAAGYRTVTGKADVVIAEPPHTHTLVHHERVEATEDTAGNIEYWECSGCHKYFSDEKGEHEISYSSVVIPKKNKPEEPSDGSSKPVEPVITLSDNKPMAVSTETVGEFKVTYPHMVPFAGKAKLTAELFGENLTVSQGNATYKVTKLKVNKKKMRIQITGLENADKSVVKAVKGATKGDNGLPFKFNPYYVKDTDDVGVKQKKDGNISSVKVKINGKFYKAKKDEWNYDSGTKIVAFKGNNLNGSYTVK